ncbi:MAG TPA: hypothetical protein VMZ22_01500 [Acidimicrobiales bacterium]|nr:hypothetical protein [Acidimicrobiales bacterium]
MPDINLDDRIRNLVASAVADAPPAPEVPNGDVVISPRRPWMKWTAALAALIAIAGGGGLALRPADETNVVTESDPDPTTSTTVAPAPAPPVIVTAGPDGVFEIEGDQRRAVTTEPMAFALALDDGTFVAQRSRGNDGGSTHPLFIGNDGEITGEMFAGANLAGPVHLHDFSVVDGRRLLLYSIQASGDPETASEPLFALDLDSDDTIELGNIGGWETGTRRLHLGANGLIAGTMYSEASHALLVRAIPGSPAAKEPLPKAADYRLAESYDDCACPVGFVLNASGGNLYWLEPHADGAVLKVSAVGIPAPVSPGWLPGYRENVGGIDIDISQRGVVFSAGTGVTGSEPFLLKEDGTRESLPGTSATVGHNG